MTGWLLIFSLLLLGGVLSTLGDRLGSRVGKARLSIFNLRPRSTAVLITVLTGSLISALSLGFMLLVSRQLRVGLFELDALQTKLQNSRKARNVSNAELARVQNRINVAEKELGKLETNLMALRRGDVVLSSGQSLVTATFKLDSPKQAREVIDSLLQKANYEAYRRVRPGEKPNRQILLVPRGDINRLEEIIREEGTWVVNIRSAANFLLGEKLVYGFPEVRPNTKVVSKGEILATTILQSSERSSEAVRKKIKLLLASTLAEVKRRGSLSSGLEFDANAINDLGKLLIDRTSGSVQLETLALRNSDTADQVAVSLRPKGEFRFRRSRRKR